MEKEIEKGLIEAVKAAYKLTDRAKKKRLIRELTALINGVFKNKESRIILRELAGAKTKKTELVKEKGGFEGYEEYQPGKSKPKQQSKSDQTSVATAKKTKPTKVKDVKPTSKAKEIGDLTEEEAFDLVKMPNDKLIEWFGGIGKVKKFAKIQGITVNQRLKGDEYVNPFKEELKKLLGIVPDHKEGDENGKDEEE